jgi:hypothetical protein
MYLMSCVPFSFALLLGLTCATAARAADTRSASGDEPLAVLGIADGANKSQSDALTTALKRALDASVEWNSLEVGSTMSTWMSSASCPDVPDQACLSRIARKTGLTRFVWGTLKQKHGRVTAQLWLYAAESPGSTAQLEYSASMIDTFDENLLRLANNGLVQLLGALHFPVVVRSREASGTLVVDDVIVGSLAAGTASVAIAAGDHRFRLVLPDATVIARSFQVRIESANHLRLDFISIPES